jgi:YD repeat-containing protein
MKLNGGTSALSVAMMLWGSTGALEPTLLGVPLTTHFTYDSAHRLQSVVRDQKLALHYQYDASGNRTNRVVVTQVNASADYDANGIVDLWELSYFGRLGADPGTDPDADGANNLAESRSWTNPQDAASNLHFTQVTISPSAVVLQWEAHPSVVYRLWWTDNPGQWEIARSLVVSGGSYSEGLPSGSPRFYRLSIDP